MINEYLLALWETVYMVFFSSLFSIILGFIAAITLFLTEKNGIKENSFIYKTLDFVVNILRSFPFIILMIAIIPLTKFIIGTSIGTSAAIIPLTIGAFPFATRVIYSSLKEVPKGLIEAAQSFGCNNFQIIFSVLLKESLPSIIRGITLTVINLVGYSAMAGAIGAKGLGDLAIRYGYHRFKTDVMIVTIIILIILVQLIQFIGDTLSKRQTV
ncbi:methionine ABC transporter permease [Hathewaya histolytica]|uniref:Binding-protein-dependent transport system inner membrane protein n=1 Tax=Hathewaya histolytica TaxID=1498 RepID=A0A4V6KBF1_HATHI|nr:methionine ABC transporter permease [Hathewaya histolytica]VTQ82317.1 binding-protein-dependent transport system inner membrane protein [Hathewaya histolytica]